MRSKLGPLFPLLRIRQWWYSKIPMYLAIGLMLGVGQYSFRQNITLLSLLFVWLVGGAAFGYFLNDCFDIAQDRAAGKPNASETLAPRDRILLLIALALLSLLPWIISARPDLMLLALLQIGVFMLYSIGPVRLKDRLYAGIVADSLYAYLIPIVLILLLYNKDTPDASYLRTVALPLVVWSVATGLKAILYHHIEDRKKDASTAAGNVVNRFGLGPNVIALNFLLLVELASFCIFYIRPPFVTTKAILLFIYIVFSFTTFNRFGPGIAFIKKIRLGQVSFFNFYERWLLYIISALAIYTDWRYAIVLAVCIMLFMINALIIRPYFIILRLYYMVTYRIVIPALYILLFNLIRPPVSYLVNHGIYLFRIWILRLSDKEARSRTTYLPFANVLNMKPPGPHQFSGIAYKKLKEHNFKLEFLTGPLTDDNKIVNALWIGNSLSKIELLTIRSFIENGHEFHLWVYEPIKTRLPEGVIVEDANEIIDASKIFRYKYTNHFGHGKGSVSGFSDIFRYKLLYEKGGWWTDMDMTCLRPLQIASPYFFRSHHELFLVGNIMKVPKGSELMDLCYREASETIDENNRDWHKPIEILNKYVDRLHLDPYVFCGYSNEDKWDEVELYAKGKIHIPPKYMVLHWMNEEWRSRNMDKDDLRMSSTLAGEMIKHQILQRPRNRLELWKNELRHLLYLPFIE